ncbi:hypothetical protein EDB81DRAFT_903352 [Dactylonectria macrodidyma]|uniref:FAD-binding PCMH-type domain-containing protein n=1 Tax=Dactylonectria macrodidyma TaxID=307937 RepID=A0A9P9EBF7_9HYPO|nr:hypothetical protein EDB81DRAFT_903352 [Dactylonectria macrodidyma]
MSGRSGFVHALLFSLILIGEALGAPKVIYGKYGNQSWPIQIAHLAFDSSWPGFVNKTTRWSTFEAPTFNEVFLPETIKDLSLGLQYLSSTDKIWLAKSGGHGYSPTLAIIQDAVMINMEKFDSVTMNSDLTVTVGSGAEFRDLVNTVGNAGRELTVGACACVGVMGATLGGGLGRLQVVLWNGTIVKASEKVNPDLFWGLRGAGQNFGVVAEVTFATWPAANNGLQYNADLTFTRDNLEALIDVTNDLLETEVDPALAIMVVYGSDPVSLDTIILMNIVYAGPQDAARAVVSRYSELSVSVTGQMVPWTNLTSVALGGLIDRACVPGRRHNQHSVLTRTLDKKTLLDIYESYGAFVQDNPAARTSLIFIETFGQQGVQTLPDSYSAFPHRNAFHNAIVFSMSYTDDEVAEVADAWGRQWRDRMAEPEISGYDDMHVYQNYAHGDEPKSALYGHTQWRHQRLSKLKSSYDPQGYFNGYHEVPPSLEDWS